MFNVTLSIVIIAVAVFAAYRLYIKRRAENEAIRAITDAFSIWARLGPFWSSEHSAVVYYMVAEKTIRLRNGTVSTFCV